MLGAKIYDKKAWSFICNSILSAASGAELLVPRELRSQSRQSVKQIKLFLQSSELGLPQHPTRRRVCPPTLWFWGEGHTRRRERGWESPNSNERHTLWYSLYLCTLWLRCFSRDWSHKKAKSIIWWRDKVSCVPDQWLPKKSQIFRPMNVMYLTKRQGCGSGFNRGSGPDPGGQKWPTKVKNIFKSSCFEVLDGLFWEGFFCNLDVLYVGLGMVNCSFWYRNFFFQL